MLLYMALLIIFVNYLSTDLGSHLKSLSTFGFVSLLSFLYHLPLSPVILLTEFLCITLAVLELTLWTRQSQI